MKKIDSDFAMYLLFIIILMTLLCYFGDRSEQRDLEKKRIEANLNQPLPNE